MDAGTYDNVWEKKLSGPFVSGRAEIVYKLLPDARGRKLLDIGCGSGEIGLVFKHRFVEIHGIDISEKALAAACTRQVITRRVDLNKERLPYPSQNFEMVTCLDVIEHVFDPWRLLSEIHRVLSSKGVLVLSTPNIGFITFRLRLLTGTFPTTSPDPTPYDGGHIHYWTVKDMAKLLNQQAFRITAIGSTGRFTRLKNLWPNLLTRNPFIIAERTG
jgi:methionine biosynthesis protein MetW